MALVIVTTGHHYFLDIVGGGIVVGLAFTLVKTSHPLFQSRRPTRPV
jgi:membrane-associated phospholipid phosphatase